MKCVDVEERGGEGGGGGRIGGLRDEEVARWQG